MRVPESARRLELAVTHHVNQEAALATAPRRVLLQFRAIANAVRSQARQAQQRHLIGNRKLLALRAIADAPGVGVKGLARSLGVRQPTASQIVKALAALHLVQVRSDERDQRAVRIHASAAGLAVLRNLPGQFDLGDRLNDALGRLNQNALSSLESGLAAVLKALLPAVAQASEGDTV